MKKILLFLSLLTFIGVQTGCESHRQLQEEVEQETESTKTDSIPDTPIEKGFDGRESGGGGSNR